MLSRALSVVYRVGVVSRALSVSSRVRAVSRALSVFCRYVLFLEEFPNFRCMAISYVLRPVDVNNDFEEL